MTVPVRRQTGIFPSEHIKPLSLAVSQFWDTASRPIQFSENFGVNGQKPALRCPINSLPFLALLFDNEKFGGYYIHCNGWRNPEIRHNRKGDDSVKQRAESLSFFKCHNP